ncbi:MAG: hypothetical protein FJ100_23730 [Deltaproteobacteria bacterium]|nr:hypothetical protein [Deltaproteobacteria bacterium]
MNIKLYSKIVDQVSNAVATAVLEHEPDLARNPLLADGAIRKVLQHIGQRAVGVVVNKLANDAVETTRAQGFTKDEEREIEITTVFGPVAVASPRMRSKYGRRKTCRPVAEALGLKGKARTPAVERALCDFGSEESFGKASKRFEDHYGFEVGRTSVLRIVHEHAAEAQSFVAKKLAAAEAEFDKPLAERPGVPTLFGGVDGHMLRTGTLHPTNDGRQSEVRKLPKRTRETKWRDVRVGVVRPDDQVNPTYVAAMDSYPVVIKQLFGAACSRGLSDASAFVCTADGGNGLRDEVQAQFARCKFILDKMHVVEHLGKAADAIGKGEADKRPWIAQHMRTISAGKVTAVIADLRKHKGKGQEDVRQPANYLDKFKTCVAYDAYAAKGWPIGSGQTESAHRTVSQERMKLPGAWWLPESINPMMALRVLRENNWWPDYWAQGEKNA